MCIMVSMRVISNKDRLIDGFKSIKNGLNIKKDREMHYEILINTGNILDRYIRVELWSKFISKLNIPGMFKWGSSKLGEVHFFWAEVNPPPSRRWAVKSYTKRGKTKWKQMRLLRSLDHLIHARTIKYLTFCNSYHMSATGSSSLFISFDLLPSLFYR